MTPAEAARAILRHILTAPQRQVLRTFVYQKRRALRAFLYQRDLSRLATLFRTDKHGRHYYTQHYQRHFEILRRKTLNILEIGIGGSENPKEGGASLRMWKRYFPNSYIFGIDIYDKTPHDEERIKTFRGSQTDEAFLTRVVGEIGSVDIVIDDGSHRNDHVITTFKILFPLLSPTGIYVIEDVQTSYWAEFDGVKWGGSSDLTAPYTSMNFLKSLIDGLNHEEFIQARYTPTYFDRHIVGMHFYHNLIFIYKGLNNEGSNAEEKLSRVRERLRQANLSPSTLPSSEHPFIESEVTPGLQRGRLFPQPSPT